MVGTKAICDRHCRIGIFQWRELSISVRIEPCTAHHGLASAALRQQGAPRVTYAAVASIEKPPNVFRLLRNDTGPVGIIVVAAFVPPSLEPFECQDHRLLAAPCQHHHPPHDEHGASNLASPFSICRSAPRPTCRISKPGRKQRYYQDIAIIVAEWRQHAADSCSRPLRRCHLMAHRLCGPGDWPRSARQLPFAHHVQVEPEPVHMELPGARQRQAPGRRMRRVVDVESARRKLLR